MNVNSINNVNAQKKQKKGTALGSIGASMAGSLVPIVTIPISLQIIKGMGKVGDLSQDKIDIIKNGVDKALKISGMDKKGVVIERIPYVAPNARPTLQEVMDSLTNPVMAQVKQGKNACFSNKDFKSLMKKNHIYLPENKISFAGFHEIGHSINYNASKIGKILQKGRLAMYAAPIIALIGAFSRTKSAQDGEKLSKKDKVINAIRNNAGKLSFLVTLPMLAEEAMATIKGQKLAKQVLPTEAFKNVTKGNKIAYCSYLITALGLALASYITVKVKDKHIEKRNR